MLMFNNLIDGEWCPTAPVRPTSIRPTPTTSSARPCAARARRPRPPIAAAKAAFPAWSRSTPQVRYDILKKASDEILARKDELGRLLSREEGKTLPKASARRRAPGRSSSSSPAKCLRLAGEKLPSRAARRRRRDHPRAGRRRRHDHAVEFPDRHSGLEDRAGARLRQHRGVQAGRPRAGLRLGARRYPAPRRPAEGRAQPRHGHGLGGRRRRSSNIPTSTRDHLHRLGRHRPARSRRGASRRADAKFQLEMGGKNPLVVLDDADLKVAVECAVQRRVSSRPASAARPRRG